MNNTELSTSRVAFTVERRRDLLDEYFGIMRGFSDIRRLLATSSGIAMRRLVKHYNFYMLRLDRLRAEYIAGVPAVPLSRCPFTNEVMQHSIDDHGLDGLWWDYNTPARPGERLPSSYFAMTGALRLKGSVSRAPFLCKPGPEVPYVVPRLLRYSMIMAVISSIPVDEHQGYVITYFARPVPLDIPRINTWGAIDYVFPNDKGKVCWDTHPYDPKDFYFELEPWISAGRVRWIAPGDQTLTLRDTTSGCPYLGLEGRRTITRIQEGKVWW